MKRALSKIPFSVYPSFWVLAFFISISVGTSVMDAFVVAGIVFISVLVHEMGHAITAMFFGQSVMVELRGLGGVTIPLGDKLSPGREFIVVLMGPIFGFLLAISCKLVLSVGITNQLIRNYLYFTAVAN